MNGIVYARNGISTANSVKRIFGTGFLASRKDNFQAKGRKGNHNLLRVAPASRKFPKRPSIATCEFVAIIAQMKILSTLLKSLNLKAK
jgi:hypothetical protein